jgi:hypothetical protein
VLQGSSRARSVAEMIRRGSRVILLACRAHSARGDADVVAMSYGRGSRMSMSYCIPGSSKREE